MKSKQQHTILFTVEGQVFWFWKFQMFTHVKACLQHAYMRIMLGL
jgi:hypothetical protein